MPDQSVTLQWAGKAASPLSGPAKLDGVSPSAHHGYLLEGDNLAALTALQEDWQDRFTLAYLDPPFLTGKQHHKVTRSRDRAGKIVRKTSLAFDDRWTSLGEYLSALKGRIELVHGLLRNDGCLVVHVDPKTSHYVKVLCDEVFGPGCFASEIIWRYRRWPAKTVNFQRVHDVLLRYVKDPAITPRFTTLYEPLAPSTLATWGDRKQRAIVGSDGRRERSSRSKEASKGAPLGDVWEIGIVAPVSRERTGYPTQKPEALLERLIQSCSAPGDWILDPYTGSGTTLAVGRRLERKVVGIDSSPEALNVAESRLRDQGTRIERKALRVLRATTGALGAGVRKAS